MEPESGRDPPKKEEIELDNRRGAAWAGMTGVGILIPMLVGASWMMAILMGAYFSTIVAAIIYRWPAPNARLWAAMAIAIAGFAASLWAFGVPNATPFRAWLFASLLAGGAAVPLKPWLRPVEGPPAKVLPFRRRPR